MRHSLFILFIFLNGLISFGQLNPNYTAFSESVQGLSFTQTGNAVIAFTTTSKANSTGSATPVLRERNRSAKLYMMLDLGNNYVKNGSNWNFYVKTEITYQLGPSAVTKTLNISQDRPEMLRVDDVSTNFANTAYPFSSTITILGITDGSTSATALSGMINNFVVNNLRFSVQLIREYDVDVRLASNGLLAMAPVINTPTLANRVVTLSWRPNLGNTRDYYPNYQLQIVKLYNTNPTLQNDPNQISTTADWSKALTIETESYKTNIQLTLGEGSGYYLWRVRPVGTYFKGAIGNSENYGEWSYSDPGTMLLQKSTLQANNNPLSYAFYLTDPDENLNWMYSRVFSEGDDDYKTNPTGPKVSEGISYADGLDHLRQSQIYNSEENVSITSQNITDYSGRPALNTLPVPVAGRLSGYKNNFATATSNSTQAVYTAANFDCDAKLDHPDLIFDGTGSAFAYFSGIAATGVNNANVPDAQGYGFSRIRYKSDGTGRIEEESGAGKAFSIGMQTNGQGHTKRISYGTPSEDELIWIFGNEAPLPESVIKTITTDENNVVSVNYTSKEGKTIATALSSGTTSNLSALTANSSVVTVSNTINENTNAHGKIVASKRIAVSGDNTIVNLNYTIGHLPGSNAGCIASNCNFAIRLYLTDIKNNIRYVSDADLSTAGITNFSTTSSSASIFPSNPGWGFVSMSSPSVVLTPTGTLHNQLLLNQGEYLFTKELFSANGSNYADSLADSESIRTRLILNAITDRMQAVNNSTTQSDFVQWMSDLKTAVAVYTASPSAPLSAAVWTLLSISPTVGLFPVPPDFDLLALAPAPGETGSARLGISTRCCGPLSVNIPNPDLCAVCDGVDTQMLANPSISNMSTANSTAGDNPTPYGLKDFEADANWQSQTIADQRQAISSLVDREFITPLQEQMDEAGIHYADLWKIAPGFTFESLKFMITNMLLSRYYTGSNIFTSGNWYECSKNTSGTYTLGNIVNSVTYDHNYDCKKLYESWIAAVNLLGSFDADSNNNNILSEHDNSEGPNAALNQFLQLDNWPPALKTTIQALEGVISRVVNKFKHSRAGSVPSDKIKALTNLPASFVDLAGRQFAAIIDGSTLPGYISNTNTPPDYFSFASNGNPGGDPSIYTQYYVSNIGHSFVPYLFDSQGSVITNTCNHSSYNELCYPYVLKPEWQFKYFVYNVFNDAAIGDNDHLIPHQVITDIAYKYNSLYSYLSSSPPTPLCQEPPVVSYSLGVSSYSFTYDHSNWSAAERNDFYEAIRGAGACPEEKGIDNPNSSSPNAGVYYAGGTPPQCETKDVLIQEAKDELDAAITNCQAKADNIKAALVNELTNSCYNIVSCTTNDPSEVTNEEIDLMVKAVIATCTLQIQAIKDQFTITTTSGLSACTSASLLVESYDGNSQCHLPACIQQNCSEIVLYDDNTIGIKPSRKLQVIYFKTCDQKILDMIENGQFIPDIPGIGNCNNKPAKDWKNCNETAPCGSANYSEKVNCPSSAFESYSKKYSISATAH